MNRFKNHININAENYLSYADTALVMMFINSHNVHVNYSLIITCFILICSVKTFRCAEWCSAVHRVFQIELTHYVNIVDLNIHIDRIVYSMQHQFNSQNHGLLSISLSSDTLSLGCLREITLILWALYLRIASTSVSLMFISFHVLKNIDPKMQKKCYRHNEWVLLSITSIKFWEITTDRTSKKRKLNQAFSRLRLSRLFWQATFVLQQAPRPIERHRETIIVVIWCTNIQLQVRMYSL